MEPDRSLFDLSGLLIDLEAVLQTEVDVVTERGLRTRFRERVHPSVARLVALEPQSRSASSPRHGTVQIIPIRSQPAQWRPASESWWGTDPDQVSLASIRSQMRLMFSSTTPSRWRTSSELESS